MNQEPTQTEIATLGGGCFWCLEAVYDDLIGVQSVVSGYAGGHVPNPTYEQVCGKRTGHAEVVQVTFDPSVISYREILEVFFTIHDPTTPNRQGNDVGPQYRSAIFTHDEAQKQTAQAISAEFDAEICVRISMQYLSSSTICVMARTCPSIRRNRAMTLALSSS